MFDTEPITPEVIDPQHRRIAELESRIASLEAERDELAQQNSELFVLQQVISTMSSTLEIDDILSMVLRGVREALRFGRVVLFGIGEGKAVRRLQTDAEGNVVLAIDPGAFRETPALRAMIDKKSDLHLGMAGDADAPLSDTRGAYAMVPLVSRDVARGILYVDDAPSDEIGDNQLRTLLDFAAQAAIATENASLLAETQRLALTDPLTGLLNRRALSEMLDRELHNAERYAAQIAFCIFDLDDLKKINDSNGHAAGDWALKNFADILRRCARKGDIVARYAGDEFVIVMANTSREQAEQGVERIFRTLRREGVKCSVGAALFPYDGTDGEALFFAADEALYQAKGSGKNRYVFFDKTARTEAQPIQ